MAQVVRVIPKNSIEEVRVELIIGVMIWWGCESIRTSPNRKKCSRLSLAPGLLECFYQLWKLFHGHR